MFLGNDVLLNAVQLITFLYFINIRNILTECYIWYQSNGFQKIFGVYGE